MPENNFELGFCMGKGDLIHGHKLLIPAKLLAWFKSFDLRLIFHDIWCWFEAFWVK